MDIDYVITWVDGADPRHAEARQKYSKISGDVHVEAMAEERFIDNGEIYYNIASVLKFAPFVRRIYIITDNQRPKFLDSFVRQGKCDSSFLHTVSHDEIFSGLKAARPSFNSLSIEAAIWRIPGLSEHFIYSNDDFFFSSPAIPSDFFRNGKPILHGRWTKAQDRRLKYKIRGFLGRISSFRYTKPDLRTFQWRGAVRGGVRGDFLEIHHNPHPLRRSTFEDYFSQNSGVLDWQIGFQFRDAEQFCPLSLANHLEISKYGAIPLQRERSELAYLDPSEGQTIYSELQKIVYGTAPFGCVQGFETYQPDFRAEVHRVLTEKFRDFLPHELLPDHAVFGIDRDAGPSTATYSHPAVPDKVTTLAIRS